MAEENVQARKRAAKRSMNFKAGKPLDEAPAVADEAPTAEGGIVAEAKEEAAQVGVETPAETPIEEAPVEAPVEAAPEIAAEDSDEMTEEPPVETPAEEAPSEAPAENPFEEEPVETPPEEAPMEPKAEMPMEAPAEPTAEMPQEPAGPTHDELIDQYHEALAYGDLETARSLYKALQDHRYQENMQRTRSEGEAQQQMAEYVATAEELAAKHPELSEDGIAVEKVMTLADFYRSKGSSPSEALRMAVADLFPENNSPQATEDTSTAPVMEATETATPEPEAEVETMEAEKPVEEEKPSEEPESEASSIDAEAKGNPLPDMTERKARKAKLSVVPTASARNTPPPPKEAPTRSDAIAEMRKRRGQG